MIAEHSILAPSSAKIWAAPGGCTGWPGMAQRVPDLSEEGEEARAGTASHEAGEQRIWKSLRADSQARVLDEGDTAANGVIIDMAMVQGAEMYAREVYGEFKPRQGKKGLSFGIEKKLPIATIHEMCFGTPDAWLYASQENKLFLWDYKFGFLTVEAFENWPAVTYLAGLFKKLGVVPEDVTVHVRIIQPRASHPDGPVREWKVNGAAIQGLVATVRENARVATGPHAQLTTGSHCRYCHARYACPEALKAGMGFYEMAGAPVPVELSPVALGVQNALVTRALEQLKGLKTGYDEQIKALQKQGTVVPGWELRATVGREAWNKPVAEVIQMGELMEKDLRKPGACTPNQARALGVDSSVISAYSHKPSTGFKLIQDDGSTARRIFEE